MVLLFQNSICPQSCVTRKLTDIFKLQQDETGYIFKGVTEETKAFYRREFEKRCRWDEAINGLVNLAYPSTLSRAYSTFLYGVKNKPRKGFMKEEVYNAWATYWDSTEGKRRSWLGKLCRHGGEENGPVSRHTGGGLSMLEICDLLSRALGRPVDPYTLFVFTHTCKHDGVTFFDERSRRINERVVETRERMRQVGGEVDGYRVYYESVGGFNNRSRFYGLREGSGFYAQSRSTFDSALPILRMPQMTEDVQRMQRDIQTLIASRQSDQSRMDGIESHLERVLGAVADLRAEIEILHSDIVLANESNAHPQSS